MRPLAQLVHSRTRIAQRYALFPLEGYPFSRLPTWPGAQVRVLASPRLGAEFVQYLIDVPAGAFGIFSADPAIENFVYVLSGKGLLRNDQRQASIVKLRPGSFALLPPNETLSVLADSDGPLSLIVLRKRYVTYSALKPGAAKFSVAPLFKTLIGHESKIKKEIWAGDGGALLQTLVPDEFQFDLAMNIFTFSPGHGLPIVETHVMEHGALILQGKGLYHLAGEWMEVEKDDFIWMGPYCPQSFYATGPGPAKYLYYKNVNREIPL